MLNAKKLNYECKLEMTNKKCTIDCTKYNVKWNIEFWRKWNAIEHWSTEKVYKRQG